MNVVVALMLIVVCLGPIILLEVIVPCKLLVEVWERGRKVGE